MPPRQTTPTPIPLPSTHVAPETEERRPPTPEPQGEILPPIEEIPEHFRRSPSPDYRRSRSVPDETRSVYDETTASLTEAILLMTKELRRRENPTRKVKAKEPDTYDGSDPRKLNNFILQCNLFFRSDPVYDDEAAR